MPSNQRRAPAARRRRRRRTRWRIENPLRFAAAVLILVLLLVLLISQVARCGRAKPADPAADSPESVSESAAEPVSESEAESVTEPEPAQPTGSTRLEDLDRQIMGFVSGVLLSNEENHARDPETEEGPQKVQYRYHILLDPLHGGEDTGVQANGIVESEFNLLIAQRLQMRIRELDPDIEVYLTREDNSFVEIEDRVRMANEKPADLYVGIQCTAFEDDPEVAGVAVMFWDGEPSTERGQKSLKAAMALVDVIAKALDRPNAGAQIDLSEVLYQTEMPAVSLRLGFLTNDYDAAALLDERLQGNMIEAAAEQIVAIVNTYLPHVDVEIPEVKQVQDSSSEPESLPETTASEPEETYEGEESAEETLPDEETPAEEEAPEGE